MRGDRLFLNVIDACITFYMNESMQDRLRNLKVPSAKWKGKALIHKFLEFQNASTQVQGPWVHTHEAGPAHMGEVIGSGVKH